MISREDRDELMEYFDARYKLKTECDDEMGEVSKKLANDNTQFAVINTKLSLILWFLGALGAAVIGTLVKLGFGS